MRALTSAGSSSNKTSMKTNVRTLMAIVASLLAVAGVAAAEAPATFKVGEFTFTRPAKWDWIEATSPMRKAELRVNDPKGKADVIFFNFGGGQGGGTKANIDRWLGQFQESREKINPKIQETIVGKRKVTYVNAQGTYMS